MQIQCLSDLEIPYPRSSNAGCFSLRASVVSTAVLDRIRSFMLLLYQGELTTSMNLLRALPYLKVQGQRDSLSRQRWKLLLPQSIVAIYSLHGDYPLLRMTDSKNMPKRKKPTSIQPLIPTGTLWPHNTISKWYNVGLFPKTGVSLFYAQSLFYICILYPYYFLGTGISRYVNVSIRVQHGSGNGWLTLCS